MLLLDYLFLPMLIFIGSVTSYQDFCFGKIKNKWIVLGLAWGIAVYCLLFFWSQLSSCLPPAINSNTFLFKLPADYLFKVFLNSSISLLAGYALWHFKLWSAGDAKLFVVFSLLLPLGYYFRSVFPQFLSIVLLFNTFTLAWLYMIAISIYGLCKDLAVRPSVIEDCKDMILSGKNYLKHSYWDLLKGIFLFFSVLFAFQIIRYVINYEIRLTLQQSGGLFLIVFFIFSRFSGRLRRFLKTGWLLLAVYLVIIPSLFFAGFLSSIDNFVKIVHIMKNSLFFSLLVIPLLYLFSYASKNEKTAGMPFAVWLFLGVIITIILKGSLISLLLNPHTFWQ